MRRHRTLALGAIKAPDHLVFIVDFDHQLLDLGQLLPLRTFFKQATQMCQTNGTHVAAAAFEAMGNQRQVAGLAGVVQLTKTLFGVGKEGVQQLGKPSLITIFVVVVIGGFAIGYQIAEVIRNG